MNKTTEALKLAEEALLGSGYYDTFQQRKALAAIREALAQPVKQKPVAVISESAIGLVKLHSNGACLPFGTQLYADPVSAPKQEPVAKIVLNRAGQIAMQKPDGDYFDISKHVGKTLYAASVSAKREWVDITKAEQLYLLASHIDKLTGDVMGLSLIDAVIAAFKEKNK